jgi:hypothetical protein
MQKAMCERAKWEARLRKWKRLQGNPWLKSNGAGKNSGAGDYHPEKLSEQQFRLEAWVGLMILSWEVDNKFIAGSLEVDMQGYMAVKNGTIFVRVG